MASGARRPTRAVLFDLDGTLYRQRPLRLRMLRELALTPFRDGPLAAARTLRSLRAFRSVREELRELGRPDEPLDDLQYRIPAGRLGIDPASLRGTVQDWMHERPLRHLGACRRGGVEPLLVDLAGRGLRMGVFSDYPVETKLEALGLRGHFELALCATDPEINAFKPHPRGFARACELWSLEAAEVLYVGDRVEVDAAGAAAAGMPSVVVSDESPGLEEVLDVLAT